MTLQDTTGAVITVTDWDHSETHFTGTVSKGKLKGRELLFLKTRPYTVLAK